MFICKQILLIKKSVFLIFFFDIELILTGNLGCSMKYYIPKKTIHLIAEFIDSTNNLLKINMKMSESFDQTLQ